MSCDPANQSQRTLESRAQIEGKKTKPTTFEYIRANETTSMAQQNSTYYSSHRDDSKPKYFPTHSYIAYPRQTETRQEMTRHLSKDSA
jgi:hypothetical protein